MKVEVTTPIAPAVTKLSVDFEFNADEVSALRQGLFSLCWSHIDSRYSEEDRQVWVSVIEALGRAVSGDSTPRT